MMASGGDLSADPEHGGGDVADRGPGAAGVGGDHDHAGEEQAVVMFVQQLLHQRDHDDGGGQVVQHRAQEEGDEADQPHQRRQLRGPDPRGDHFEAVVGVDHLDDRHRADQKEDDLGGGGSDSFSCLSTRSWIAAQAARTRSRADPAPIRAVADLLILSGCSRAMAAYATTKIVMIAPDKVRLPVSASGESRSDTGARVWRVGQGSQTAGTLSMSGDFSHTLGALCGLPFKQEPRSGISGVHAAEIVRYCFGWPKSSGGSSICGTSILTLLRSTSSGLSSRPVTVIGKAITSTTMIACRPIQGMAPQ